LKKENKEVKEVKDKEIKEIIKERPLTSNKKIIVKLNQKKNS